VTWPLQPVGPRPQGPPRIEPTGRSAPPDRRRERGDQERDREKRDERPSGEGPVRPDEGGHIDVLA
jgi:hypothetical protein